MTEAVIQSLAGAFFPSVSIPSAIARDADGTLDAYLQLSGACLTGLPVHVLGTLETYLPANHKRDLSLAGTLLLAGPQALTPCFPYVQPFAALPEAQQEAMLQFWARSRIPLLRKAFKGMKALIAYNMFCLADKLNAPSLWKCLSYAGASPPLPEPSLRTPAAAERRLMDSIVDLATPRTNAELQTALTSHGLASALQPAHGKAGTDVELEVTCDAVIVGSGAGGGVAAQVLAAAGLKVVVIEKGHYIPAHELTWREQDGFSNMYERGGLLVTQTGGVAVLAGTGVGGGTRVNWSAALRTPEHVRREWANEHGLPSFASAEYDAALDAVCERIGVNTDATSHTRASVALLRGLQKLGAHSQAMPRNCRRSDCGWCGLGCARGAKQDTAATFLADAAADGAVILTGAYAQQVETEPIINGAVSSKLPSQVQKATGVLLKYGQLNNRRLRIRADIVIAAAGALHTPALLLRSGITGNGNVGRNLRLHPAHCVTGIFPALAEADPEDIGLWDGPIMSVYSKEVADWQGKGYGALLSTPSGHTGLMAAVAPWVDGASWKLRLAAAGRSAPILVYVRDRDSGRVTLDAEGQPSISYWPSAADGASMLKGMELAAKVLKAAGATAMYTWQEAAACSWSSDPATVPGEPDFDAYIRNMHATGVHEFTTTVCSAHQMGSARMGSEPGSSVADGRGESWQVAGLYIADASALPTSTGTNPMVTIEATAYMTAQRIAAVHGRAKQASKRRTAQVAYEDGH